MSGIPILAHENPKKERPNTKNRTNLSPKSGFKLIKNVNRPLVKPNAARYFLLHVLITLYYIQILLWKIGGRLTFAVCSNNFSRFFTRIWHTPRIPHLGPVTWTGLFMFLADVGSNTGCTAVPDVP
jgi:hypothetical protein